MKSGNNKYLIVKESVTLNEELDSVIYSLEPIFKDADHVAYVTSGVRAPEDQLRIIKEYLAKNSIPDEFIRLAKVDSKVTYAGEEIYTWQLGWSKLLNAGIIINPPLRAKLLLDYINKAGKNRAGDYFNPSVHFSGKAFDIGGGSNSVEDEKQIIIAAIKKGGFPKIKNFVVERQNNCLHIDIT